MKVKRITSGGVARKHDPAHPPKQRDFNRTGEWKDVLTDSTRVHNVVLDEGAFQWVWDIVELKANIAVHMLKRPQSFGPGFVEAYSRAVFAARDAFRDTAAGDTASKITRAERVRETEDEAQKLEAATAPPAMKASGKTRKIKRRKSS